MITTIALAAAMPMAYQCDAAPAELEMLDHNLNYIRLVGDKRREHSKVRIEVKGELIFLRWESNKSNPTGAQPYKLISNKGGEQYFSDNGFCFSESENCPAFLNFVKQPDGSRHFIVSGQTTAVSGINPADGNQRVVSPVVWVVTGSCVAIGSVK